MTTKFNKVVNKLTKWAKQTGSQIVDKNGFPLICFHETNHSFDEAFTKNNMGSGNYGRGFYFGVGFKYWEKFGVKMKNAFACVIGVKNCYPLYEDRTLLEVVKMLNMKDVNEMYKGTAKLEASSGSIKYLLTEISIDLVKFNISKDNYNVDYNEINESVWNKFVEYVKSNHFDALIDKSPEDYPILLIFSRKKILRLTNYEATVVESVRRKYDNGVKNGNKTQ